MLRLQTKFENKKHHKNNVKISLHMKTSIFFLKLQNFVFNNNSISLIIIMLISFLKQNQIFVQPLMNLAKGFPLGTVDTHLTSESSQACGRAKVLVRHWGTMSGQYMMTSRSWIILGRHWQAGLILTVSSGSFLQRTQRTTPITT